MPRTIAQRRQEERPQPRTGISVISIDAFFNPVGCGNRTPGFVIDNDYADLTRSVYASYKDLLDVGGSAGSADQHHRTRLLSRLRQDCEQFIQAGKNSSAGYHGNV